MNPFSIKTYRGAAYFFDRKVEIKKLLDAIESERNLTLFSNRRLGKTMLIQHVFSKLNKTKYQPIYIDLFATRNLAHLTKKLTEEFYSLGILKDNSIFKFLGKLGATLSFDPISGNPEVNLGFIDLDITARGLNELFDLLKGSRKNVVLALDEFQEVSMYEENVAEATLRTIMQENPGITFIYSGSKKSVMKNMFASAQRPFFQSTQMMELHEIEKEIYAKEIFKVLRDHNKEFEKKIIYRVLDETYCHTGFTQLVLSRIFSESESIINEDLYNQVWFDILEENKSLAREQEFLLPALQWKILVAIAKEGFIQKPQSREFIEKYSLSVPSSMARAVKALLDKGLIIESGDKGLRVYNVFILKNLQKLIYP